MCTSIKTSLDNIVSSEKSTDELYSIFKSIDDYTYPIIRFYIDANTYVIRQRLNQKNKEFFYISDLSYPPVTVCKEYGRANLPFHPMFYCCSFPSDYSAPQPRIITLMETSNFINDTKSKGIERSTCSRWDVKERLNLLALPFSKKYERTIEDIQIIQEEWRRERNREDVNKKALEIVEYMSEEIAKKSNNGADYFKIANFIYYLLYQNRKTKDSDGIIYPSVAAAGEGFNLVLKPEVADQKLEFATASLCYLVKDGLKADLIVVNHSVGQNDDGTLIYAPWSDFNIKDYPEFDFIN